MRCVVLLSVLTQATPLFNGKDLEGWKAVGSAVWKVEDGVLVGGQDGDPRKSGVLHTPPTMIGWLTSPATNITTTASSISGTLYQPNFLPSIGVMSCAHAL